MTRGPSRARGFGSIGVQASQTLGGRGVGGGVQDSVRRILTRTTPAQRTPGSESGNPGTRVDGDDGEATSTVRLPSAGIWVITGYLRATVTGGTYVSLALRARGALDNIDAIGSPGPLFSYAGGALGPDVQVGITALRVTDGPELMTVEIGTQDTDAVLSDLVTSCSAVLVANVG